MEPSEGPRPWPRPFLTKSDSNASTGAESTQSHDSLPVLGTHPLGTLRVHKADEPSPLVQSTPSTHVDSYGVHEDGDESPPPLEPPTVGGVAGIGTILPGIHPPTKVTTASDRDRKLGQALSHSMGGGDLILVLDLPDVFTIGYDSVSFTAKQFRGLREVPPGVHFLWVSHPNGFSTRCGTWVIGSSEGIRVHVLQWDKYNEILGEAAHAEERIQAAGVDETTFHRLAPYRDPAAVNQEAMAQPSAAVSERRLELWNQLTDSVSPSVLDRITAQQGHGHWFVHTADRVKGSVLMAAEMELDRRVSQNPYLQVRELNFALSQLSRTYSTDNTGADRTSDATDATVYLESLLKDHSGGLTQADIIGEFQLAYILGTHLGNDSCMQQWWHMLLKIVLRAYVLPERHPELASALLRTLAAQLSHSTEILDTSVLEYSDTQSRDLRLALTVYKRRLDELCANGGTGQLATATALSQVEAVVAAPPLDWDLDSENYLRRGKATLEDGEEVELEMDELEAEDERGEWAPEIVELDEQGRPRDLVSWTD